MTTTTISKVNEDKTKIKFEPSQTTLISSYSPAAAIKHAKWKIADDERNNIAVQEDEDDKKRKIKHGRQLIKNRKALEFSFGTASAVLNELLSRFSKEKNDALKEKLRKEIEDHIIYLIYTSYILIKVYQRHLPSQANANLWQRRHLEINKFGEDFKTCMNVEEIAPASSSIFLETLYAFFVEPYSLIALIKRFFDDKLQASKDFFRDSNWYRLALLRDKREDSSLAALFPNNSALQNINAKMSVLNAPFTHLAYAAYVPRNALNIYTVTCETFGFHLTEQQKRYTWQQRLSAQWDVLGFELNNDNIWLLVGVAGAILAAYAVNPLIGISLTVGLYGFDVANAAWDAWRQERKLNQQLVEIREKIDKLQELIKANPNNNDSIRRLTLLKLYEKELFKQIVHKRKELILNVLTTIGLFISMTIAFAGNFFPPALPILSVLGGSLVLAVCAAQFLMSRYLAKTAPRKTLDTSKFKCIPNTVGNLAGNLNENTLQEELHTELENNTGLKNKNETGAREAIKLSGDKVRLDDDETEDSEDEESRLTTRSETPSPEPKTRPDNPPPQPIGTDHYSHPTSPTLWSKSPPKLSLSPPETNISLSSQQLKRC